MAPYACPFETLGLDLDAAPPAVERAYRQLSLSCHPDKRPGDPAACAAFQALTDAKEALLDPVQRAAAVEAARERGATDSADEAGEPPPGDPPDCPPDRRPPSRGCRAVPEQRSEEVAPRWRRQFAELFGGTGVARPLEGFQVLGAEASPEETSVQVSDDLGTPIAGCALPSSARVKDVMLYVRDALGVPLPRQRLVYDKARTSVDAFSGSRPLHYSEALTDLPRRLHVKLKVLPCDFRASVALLGAAKDCDMEALQAAIRAVADPNMAGADEGLAPLHVASAGGEWEAARFLLAAGADKDLRSRLGDTPLFLAAQAGHRRAVRVLCEARADPDLAAGSRQAPLSCGYHTPLSVAASLGHLDVVSCLCQQRADVDRPASDNATALYHAAWRGHADVAKCLCSARADLERESLHGTSPLFVACQEGHLSVVRQLCAERAEVDAASSSGGDSPLIAACQQSDLAAAELLVEARADPNFTEREDRAGPLHLAADAGQAEVVRYLVEEARADVARPRRDGKTALTILRERGHLQLADEVLRFAAGGTDAGASASSAGCGSQDATSITPTVDIVLGGAVHATWPGLERAASYSLEAVWEANGACRRASATAEAPAAWLRSLPPSTEVQLRVAISSEAAGFGAEGSRPDSASAEPRLVGPWVRCETAELDFGLPGSDEDPTGCRRGGCAETACAGFASAEAQDPFVEERLAPLCFACGASFELHADLSS